MAQKVNIFSDEWCDCVFEGRNQDYGAYVFRKLSNKRHLNALLIASALFIIAISSPVILKTIIPKSKEKHVEVTTLANLKIETKQKEKIIEDLPPPPPLRSSIKFTPPVIKADKDVNEDQLKTQEELKESKLDISTADVKGNDPNGKLIGEVDPNKNRIAQEAEVKPFLIVEQMPQFPGGDEELLKYIRDNTHYPQMAKETGITGTVFVQFVVGKDGRISNVTILRGIGGGCDEEAIRVVKSMPAWKAGKQNGIAVPVFFKLPIKFTLR